jgi:hypothetical protein
MSMPAIASARHPTASLSGPLTALIAKVVPVDNERIIDVDATEIPKSSANRGANTA